MNVPERIEKTEMAMFAQWAVGFDSSLEWIDEIKWSCPAQHIKDKFLHYCEFCGNAGALALLYVNLDNHNKLALEQWIRNHFTN